MSGKKSQEEITSDDKQQLGFEFQYLFFILNLLKMQPGEEVGYEALDDVHSVSSCGIITYIQVKHTVDAAANGDLASLPRLSEDLWKTLSNWSKVVVDPKKGRDSIKRQKEFIRNSKFLLAMNRDLQKHPILAIIENASQGKVNGTLIKNALKEIETSSSNETIKRYIKDVVHLSNQVILMFFSKINIESIENLENSIYLQIKAKMIPDSYIDDVFNSLYSQLKRDFFKQVKEKKKHQILSFDEWTRKYTAVFQDYRTTLLPIRTFETPLPEHIEEQFFVKELVEIGAIDLNEDGYAEIAEFTHYYLSIQLQLDKWYEDGIITLDRRDQFHKDAYLLWKSIHKQCHISTRKDLSCNDENALKCFYSVLHENLHIMTTDIGLELSNGEFIKLANEKKIRWRYLWEGGTQGGNSQV